MQASDSHDALKIALNQIFIEKGFKATKEEFKHSISCSLFTCKTISIKNHLIVAASSDDKLHLLDLLVNHFICSNVVYPVYYVDAFRSSDLLIEFNSLVDRDIIQLVAPGLEHGDVPTVAVAPTVVPTVVHTITPTTVPPTSTRMVDPRYSLIDHSHPPFSIGDFDRDPFASSPFDPRAEYGGMIVGPNHPMFTRPRPGHNGIGPSPVPGIPNVPPGARFDPVGPFGPNPNFPFGPARPRGNPFSGDPDNDHETFRGDFYS